MDVEAEAEAEEETPKKKRRTRRKTPVKTRLDLPEHIQGIIEGTSKDSDEHRFIDLVDILPAVPKKGNFDVNTIKKSLYFFS